ncbi:MAG: hypothetical protein ACFFCV_21030 [Promethearchaeota archaeon]
MTIIFFIKSKTVNIDKYTKKDIPGSTGRLDVISRCVLSAILNNNDFERNVQIWVFLDGYGNFIFNPKFFNYEFFPKNELFFTDYFVKYLKKNNSIEDQSPNLLNSIKRSNMNIIDAIIYFKKLNYNLYILYERGRDFFKLSSRIREEENTVFIIGSQEDEYLYSKELSTLKIPTISMGNQSYLASSVIRLLKLHLLAL